MKLSDIKPEILHELSTKELMMLHLRVHQLYSLAKRRDNKDLMKSLIKTHSILISEIERRGMKHSTPL